MVYGIVKNHGGFLEMRSEAGKGSEFQLRFPAISTAEILPPAVANGKPVKGCGHILIIDDEAVVRRMAGDMMRYLGYEVTCIGDSREAVEFYREHYASIDLVMIDMIMPGLGGRECFQAMKEINPAIRAVLSTGYGQDSAVQKIIDEGVQGFIQKPYEVDDLSQMIARVLVA
jgi:DNA-binding NtrC family response regulator